MKLLEAFMEIGAEITEPFAQERTSRRAQRLMLTNLLCLGRKWISRMIQAANRDQVDWTSDYRVFSRCKWKVQDLFGPVQRRSLAFFNRTEPIVIAGDETKIKRGGRKVKRSRWTRDPQSPPFHVNFIKGIRFVQFSVLLPLHRRYGVGCRGLPVSFEPVDLPAKPGKKASRKQKKAFEQARRKNNMCQQALRQIRQLRKAYDELGACGRLLLFVLDGGFCNKTLFRPTLEGVALLARCRKDAKLCMPSNDPDHPRRIYDPEKFTPEEVRTDSSPFTKKNFFIGGKKRPVRFKERKGVLWQRSAGTQPLRLIVIAPIPYHLSPQSRAHYRDPAYFLCTDSSVRTEVLVQAAIDRWQIEVNHRDEKQHIGIEDPQVWNDHSVDRVPAFMAATYSALLLASLQAYGPLRTDVFFPQPLWQRRTRRWPSCLDLLSLLRKEAFENPKLLEPLGIKYDAEAAAQKAAA